MLAKVISASSGGGRLTEKDEKVAEQITASRVRTERVSEDHHASAALAQLAKIMESKRSAVAKINDHAKVVREFPDVSTLLKSSHVRDPRGEQITAFPGFDEVVRDARVVRSGLKAALRLLIRRMVPASADTVALVDACHTGLLFSADECAVSDLAQPSKAKPYIGVLAAAASNAAAKMSESKLIVLLKALPLIGFVMALLQPEDYSVGLVIAELSATFARGVAPCSVAEFVDGILVPFFRAYEEAFERFQKSASAEMPVMEEVWSDELSSPTALAFLSLVGTRRPRQLRDRRMLRASLSICVHASRRWRRRRLTVLSVCGGTS
jgi:hypothetical protein